MVVRFLSLLLSFCSLTSSTTTQQSNLTLHHALRRPPRRPLLQVMSPWKLYSTFLIIVSLHPPSDPPSTPPSSLSSPSTSPARPPPQTPTNGVTYLHTNDLNIP
ncbi:hypothetical protein ACN42_g6711 [Penicillium freii]|uniref:Uncharacterized protein n=1 Tax=Penicillium freii TaxID=48697 RepID=A0A117NN77_PENFR|nr:hypothetical protein ACN42_g6711 [Penicillium freii]